MLQMLFSAVLCLYTLNAEAQETEPPVSRFAFKTNALEWLLTIPNFGVDFDLVKSEYNKFTAGLAAKYNWNTYHHYVPSVVFNIFDVRPEFRYYYRTRKPTPGVVHHWYDLNKHLRDRKHPRPWRAHYVGLYGNYGHYGFKFGEKGYQGEVAGFGFSAGYALPLYEYKKGYIDVEMGFAVGLQWDTKDVFVRDSEHHVYNVVSSREDFKFTPYPVVTELRVAFAWRTKSIKDKVKDDVEKRRVQTHYEKIREDFHQPILDLTKTYYDEVLVNTKSDRERKEIMRDNTLYNEGFMELIVSVEEQQLRNISTSFPDEMKQHERKDLRQLVVEYEEALTLKVNEARKAAMKAFKKESRAHFKEVRKQMKQEKAELKKAGKEQKKVEKEQKNMEKEKPAKVNAEKEQKKSEKTKETKEKKEKKTKKDKK